MTKLSLLALAFVSLLASACASRNSALYEGDPPRLIDGEVRMTTRWSVSHEGQPDVRAVICRSGRIWCEIDTLRGRAEGPVSEEDWGSLWARLAPVSPWGQEKKGVSPDDPQGGPYHLVHLRVGGRMSEFSSQNRRDLLVFTSHDAAERLRYSNVIVDFVANHATNRLETQPAETKPSGP